MSPPLRRPRLALAYTVLVEPDTVRLVAGEDFRYTLTARGLDTWLPTLLRRLDGTVLLDEAVAALPAERREAARQLVERLASERVLIEGPVEADHPAVAYRLAVEGDGPLAERLRAASAGDKARPALAVFCQDRLDYSAALAFNRACRRRRAPWLWATLGPLHRGYVSPLFLPDAGPCLECLLGHFRRLSPVPELYERLIDHVERGGVVEPVPFPEPCVGILAELVRRKVELAAEPEPPSALYRLHVLEVATLEVTAHRVFVDPECPECGRGPS